MFTLLETGAICTYKAVKGVLEFRQSNIEFQCRIVGNENWNNWVFGESEFTACANKEWEVVS